VRIKLPNYRLLNEKCIVVKIGSSLLIDQEGHIKKDWLASLIQDVMEYWQQGQSIIIVSSGAIALGCQQLSLARDSLPLEQKQAAAAVGQIKLAHAYQELLSQFGVNTAQILLTLEDSENRKRYLNAKNTLETLLSLRVLPIINENDTVATTEICYGDNDRLAARVAQMVSANTLMLLSDIDGLYTADPRLNKDAEFIPEVRELTPALLAMAGDSLTEHGSGGMVTKLAAAKIALGSGTKMVICEGNHLHPLKRIDLGARCTWFVSSLTPQNARKNWLAHHLKPVGSLVADQGAIQALLQGKSLLSVGIIAVEGVFQKGDPIRILTDTKQEIARGLVNYSSSEAKQILGKKSIEFSTILGYQGCEEIVHRDDLAFDGQVRILMTKKNNPELTDQKNS
jgi:glutamate 5-kinase